MIVHPAIAALRGAPASQRRPASLEKAAHNAAAIKAMRDAWLARPVTRAIAEALKRYGRGQRLETCKALHSLVHDHRSAQAFVGSLLERILPILRESALAEAPFRFKVSPGLATIQLIESGGATLSLAAYEPLANAGSPQSALLSDREVHELVLRGEANAVKHRWDGEGRLSSTNLGLGPGDSIAALPQCEARQILKVEHSLLLLQLTREPERPTPTRLISIQTGETQRIASGDKSASQAVMALGVLGALGHSAALDVIERTALHRQEDQDVRWEALRQALGLNPARGLDRLRDVEARTNDPLAKPARALLAQLLDAQPELRALISEEVS